MGKRRMGLRLRRLTSSRLIFPSLSLSKWSTAALILLAV